MTDKELFRAWRKELKLSQTAAAKRLGLASRQSIWNFEQGHRKIPDTIRILMKYITKYG